MITVLKIWSAYRLKNIAQSILQERNLMSTGLKFLKRCGKTLKNHVLHLNIRRDFQNFVMNLSLLQNPLHATFAIKYLKEQDLTNISVLRNVKEKVTTSGIEKDMQIDQYSQQIVSIADQNIKQKTFLLRNTILKPVPEGVLDFGDIKEVFNLTVETYGVYYANGILVSNCDNAYDAIKIALIEKTMYCVDKKSETRKQILSGMTKSFNNKLKLGAVRNGRIG